ncbi:MAG: hypothetical protein M1831_006113 [Alyxoria varia]|nr:MAG: hypothetical protein M1831_006113 [Alyxoria varia]
MFFISYAKNFFIPPSVFGIGDANPVRSLPDALDASIASRTRVVFINNGYTGGAIEDVINQVADVARDAGKDVRILESSSGLVDICRSSLRGVTQCYAAADFVSSPDEGPGGRWNYTIRADGALGTRIYVDEETNDAQIYLLPFQHAIDSAIASASGDTVLPTVDEYPYTFETQEERARRITRLYQGTIIDIIAVAFFIGIVGVAYQLVGHMALEREQGMSQLVEAMMPNKRRWEPQVARLLANHLAFDIMYLPGWVFMGLIVAYLVFPESNVGFLVGMHLMIGFALTSYSVFFGSLFERAQLSGISSTIIALVLAIIAQIPLGESGSTGAVVVLSLLFPPMNYVFFLIYTAGFQQRTQPAVLTEYSPATDWQVTGTTFFGLNILQIFLFPILGAYMERLLYGTASKTRKMNYNEENALETVKLDSFSKIYGTGQFKQKVLCCGRRKYKEKVTAVDDLTLNILKGQIAVLLGANGSGKSTTLDAIAGLNTVSKGSIEIDATGGIGLCPQKNVLWDQLTVFEHVKIFNALKTTGALAPKSEIDTLVADCDLEEKLKARAKTLSGGQKRKLQLAMMFTGGSRVCCVDEVSSGIDPLARRKVWDILLAERGKRTILLTTHFLDEADVLSDHIAVLSKGVLKAEGSAVELKHKFGGGYRVIVENSAKLPPDLGLERVSSKQVEHEQTIYQLSSPQDVADFIGKFEQSGFSNYRVQGPTVEDVFMQLADEVKADRDVAEEAESESGRSDDNKELQSQEKRFKEGGLDLTTGRGTTLPRQTWILLRKRFTILRNNYLPYVALVLIPIIAAGFVTLFLQGFEPLGCDPNNTSRAGEISTTGLFTGLDLIYGPPDAIPSQSLQRIYPQLNNSALHTVPSRGAFNNYIYTNFSDVKPGGFFVSSNGQNPVFAYLGNYDVSASVLTQNVLDNVLTQNLVRTQYQPFDIPFSPNAGDTLQLILYFGLAMSAYPGFFALYPTAERLRKVRELHFSNGIRASPLWIAYTAFDFMFVVLVSAVTVIIFVAQWDGWYYPGYLFVVFFLYGLTSIAYSYCISLFTTSQLATFAFASGSQCVFFLIYFIAYLAILTYGPVDQIDHFVSVAHFTIALVTPSGNMARSLLLTLNEFSLLCQNQQVAPYPGAISIYGGPVLYLIVQFFLLLAFLIWWDGGGRPSLSFLRRIFRKKKDSTSADRAVDINDDETDPEDHATTASTDAPDEEDLTRLTSANNAHGLRVLNLSKRFNKTVLAVDSISFGISPSEIFALLGPNGAGKSTTISLIRGDIRPTGFPPGEVHVDNVALNKNRAAARNNLGVCPQFDAIDSMTVRQHLHFYARARGVPSPEHNVSTVMRAVGLTPYASRMASKLSGGNKRKLSLAIALMGNPSVLLLDEPSSGMDAAAKRVMWRVLSSVSTGRALLITTHSMEEADALASRAGILAGKMLALGSIEGLRERHGEGVGVHLVCRDAPHTSEEEMDRVKRWIVENVAGAKFEDRTYHGQLRFNVADTGDSLLSPAADGEPYANGSAATSKALAKSVDADAGPKSSSAHLQLRLLRLLEQHRQELGYSYYSVSPTTLDQVFLNVVRGRGVREENYTDPARDDTAGPRRSPVKRWLRFGRS